MEINLNSTIYPLEAILNACYCFIDRAYIFLDTNSTGSVIKVFFKSKQSSSAMKSGSLRGDFMNELLHSAVRYTVSKNNRKIREYITGRALYSALAAPELPLKGINNADAKSGYQEDPLGIAIPWEKKYGRAKKKCGK